MRLRHVLLSIAIVACGASAFDPQSRVASVRMFGVRADKPYAKPGETVTLEVLATDARKDKPRPLKIYWIPAVCTNPREDLYYACFVPSQATIGAPFPSDAGTPQIPDGGIANIPTGIDLGAFLPQGPTFSFRMPDDVIKQRPGSPPYGLAVIFNIACAGQVRLAQRTGAAPQQVPVQCTDEDGVQLSPDDYVLGINRVYAYSDRTNTNPVIERITQDGIDVDPLKGVTLDRCVAKRRSDCKAVKIDIEVTDASWETNPSASGEQHEQIWATYYSDIGTFKDDARLLFDAKQGRITESEVELRAPYEAGEGTIWGVVHDNRTGAAFVTLPLHVR
jgi:hypothetical protein